MATVKMKAHISNLFTHFFKEAAMDFYDEIINIDTNSLFKNIV